MRVRYSFSSRKTGQAKDPKNIAKQRPKYPAVVTQVIEDSDIILEVLDSRFIKDTRNIELEKDIIDRDKKIIYVMNKADLIQKRIEHNLSPYAAVSCKKRTGIKRLRDKIKVIAEKIPKEKVIVGVIGYPNTGKSSLINRLIGKSSAKTGAEAGFTKGLQKLRLTSKILLLDSPGVIPKDEYSSLENSKITKHTKVGARTYSRVRDPEQIIAELMREFPKVFEDYYRIDAKGDPETLLEELGRKKSILKKGGEVNFDQTARLILKDWQEGKIKLN